MKKIMVIGSSNTDMVVKSEHIPLPGETVLGGEFIVANGGKGANQAVTIAKLAGSVSFVARVGKDVFGDASLKHYEECGIDTSHIYRDEKPSGVALIMIDKQGENCISVASGANLNLSTRDVDKVAKELKEADILLMQLESPIEVVEYAAEMGSRFGLKVILNPAPARELSETIFPKLFMITPNKTEASMLSGIEVSDLESAKKAATIIAEKGVEKVVITLGSEGALLLSDGVFQHIAANRVKAVDTTAAGDVFNGAMCVGLSEGKSTVQSLEFASFVSSISVTRMGAQSSIPLRDEIETIDKNNN